mmetsp:Transcript_764/g.2354  ORF Transcript_764/g.2354 Transcript_764/m.2354 type:complete len:215 (+) Transcript_764:423-1067(+)
MPGPWPRGTGWRRTTRRRAPAWSPRPLPPTARAWPAAPLPARRSSLTRPLRSPCSERRSPLPRRAPWRSVRTARTSWWAPTTRTRTSSTCAPRSPWAPSRGTRAPSSALRSPTGPARPAAQASLPLGARTAGCGCTTCGPEPGTACSASPRRTRTSAGAWPSTGTASNSCPPGRTARFTCTPPARRTARPRPRPRAEGSGARPGAAAPGTSRAG